MWTGVVKKEDRSMMSYGDDLKFRSLSLNWAVGGGIKRGRFLNLYGVESCGKSLLAYELMADDLKNDKNKVSIIFDCECNLNTSGQIEYLKKLGVPVKYRVDKNGGIVISDDSQVLISWENDPSKIFDWTIDKVLPYFKEKNKRLSVVLVDSMQAIIPPKEANATKTTDHQMGDMAIYISKAFKKIILDSRRSGINWIFINQARDDFNSRFGGKTFSGGRAARHGYDYTLLLEKIESKDSKILGKEKDIRGNDVIIGHRVRAKLDKCRLAPAYRQAEFDIYYGSGTGNQEEEIIDFAIKRGIVKQSGAWVSYKDIRGQGTNGFIEKVDKKILNELKNLVLEDASVLAHGEKSQNSIENELITNKAKK